MLSLWTRRYFSPSWLHNVINRFRDIPLPETPCALNPLDLFPDDRDEASKKDWRAVCTTLVEGEHGDGSGGESAVANEDIEMGADSGPDSDEYQTKELSGD